MKLGFVVVVALITTPIWGDYARSTVLWFMVEKPAGCFATISWTDAERWLPPACTDWRHCSADDNDNLARGYTCGLSANRNRDVFKSDCSSAGRTPCTEIHQGPSPIKMTECIKERLRNGDMTPCIANEQPHDPICWHHNTDPLLRCEAE